MTSRQIEEHDRAFEAASQLVKGELLLHGPEHAVGMDQSVQLKLQRALQLFACVLEINPGNWSAMWLVGKVHQRLGDYSMAFTWFCRAHRINPSQADLAREASICAMFLGHSEDAISYACSALQAKPFDNGLQANLALAFLLAGRLNEARMAIDKAIASNPTDTVSQTVWHMIDHFIAGGECPPSTTAALEDYWKKHGHFGGHS